MPTVNLNGDDTFDVTGSYSDRTYTASGTATLTVKAGKLSIPVSNTKAFSEPGMLGCEDVPGVGGLWWAPTLGAGDTLQAVAPTTEVPVIASPIMWWFVAIEGAYYFSDPDAYFTADGLNTVGDPFAYGTTFDASTNNGQGVSEVEIYVNLISSTATYSRITIGSTFNYVSGATVPETYDHSFNPSAWQGNARIATIRASDGYNEVRFCIRGDNTGNDGYVVDMDPDFLIGFTPSTSALTNLSALEVTVSGKTVNFGNQSITIEYDSDPEWAGFTHLLLENVYASRIWDGAAWQPWVTLGEIRGFV